MTSKLADNFRAPLQAVLFVLGLLTVALVANELILNFDATPAEFGGWPAGVQLAADTSAGRIAYFGYAASVSMAALLGPLALLAAARGWAVRNFVISGFILASCVAAAAGVALALTSDMLGGRDMVFYYLGLGFVWLAAIVMVVAARRRGDDDTMFEWLIHSTGLAQLPAVIYPLTFALLPLGLTLEERYVGAVVLGFTGIVLVTFTLVQALRAQPAPPRAAAGPSVTGLFFRQSWFVITLSVTLAGIAYVLARAMGVAP